MNSYVLTPAARAELESIIDFVRRDSPGVALRVLDALEHAMTTLAEAPGIGRLREDLAEEPVRVWVVYSYLIVYRPTTRPLQIVHVVHGARNLVELLGAPPTRSGGKRSRKSGERPI